MVDFNHIFLCSIRFMFLIFSSAKPSSLILNIQMMGTRHNMKHHEAVQNVPSWISNKNIYNTKTYVYIQEK